jgi:lysophospholipase L1-like esterase
MTSSALNGESSATWNKVVLLGDSNTEYGFASWLNLLSDRLQRRCDVLNRGFSGYTTRFIKLILPKLMSEFEAYIEHISVVVILLGTNDSAMKEFHVDLNEFAENYQWIIGYLQSVGVHKDRIILLTPQMIVDHKWEKHVKNISEVFESKHFDRLVRPYAEKTKEIAIRNQITFVDLYGLMAEQPKHIVDDYLHDGLHYSEKGGQFVMQHLWPVIRRKLNDKNEMNYHYPNFADYEHYEQRKSPKSNQVEKFKNPIVWRKMLVLGDSNTEMGFGNWLSVLADRLKRRCDVINRGFKGYTTRHIKEILPDIMSEFESHIEALEAIVILIGTNDACTQNPLHVPLDEFSDNYQWIVDYLQSVGIEKKNIILLTPPMVDELKVHICYSKLNLRPYSDKIHEIAARNHILCVDLFSLMMSSPIDYRNFLSDGIHFSPLGGQFVADSLWPTINKTFVIERHWKENFPRWKDIQYTNDMKSLPIK